MKKIHDTLPPEQTVTALANFAWCALVALRTAQQDGQALSPLTEHAFLLRWLTIAYKQKRFPRAIASDIEGLLILGRNKGLAASLFHRLEYLWISCIGPVSAQSDLYRLTYVIEQLKAQGWINAVVSDEEWMPEKLHAEYTDTPALLARKSGLVRHFTDNGKLVGPVEFIVAGDGCVVASALNKQELHSVLHKQQPGWCMLTLIPGNTLALT
ncbi:TPA: DUF2913 family protein [Citrobacter freundii]|nr:DUF2913 family protein [Citrobacter freundii]